MIEGKFENAMAQTRTRNLQGTRDLMAALGRMPPKPHEEMKLGKSKPSPSMTPKGVPVQSKKNHKNTKKPV
jgi:hypothetical protein